MAKIQIQNLNLPKLDLKTYQNSPQGFQSWLRGQGQNLGIFEKVLLGNWRGLQFRIKGQK
jgi:hypothetical protein